MDQLKDILKKAVKYRFWIALGLSALLPLIGYLVGSGSIQDMTKTDTAAIESAAKGITSFTQPNLPNAQYPPIIKAKTETAAKDVTKAWEKLYAVQAPLLKWPDQVQDRFPKWGRKWPEGVAPGAVQQTINEYIILYPKAVDSTFAMVNPWNTLDGTGVVVVPEKEEFLRPATFDEASLPTLGEVWAAQERLWIQGTLLSAIAKINGGAKNWDSAIVKQVTQMEVGSPDAQDQVSMAKSQTVEPAPKLVPTGDAAGADAVSTIEAAATKASTTASASGGEEVYHIKTEPATEQYTIIPIKLVAMVDQNRLQDFFVGLENSPMAIQVVEFELNKSVIPVIKPVKGDTLGGMTGGTDMAYPTGPGGMSAGGMSGYPSGQGMSNMMGMMKAPSSAGMMGMMGQGAATPVKSGVDNRTKDAKKERETKEKARREKARAADTYYDVVEVTVYGQARFYNPPPAEPAAEPSLAASAPVEPAGATPVSQPAPAATAPAVGADAKPVEVSKTAEPAKPAEAPKPAEPATPVDASKAATVEKPVEAAPPAAPKI